VRIRAGALLAAAGLLPVALGLSAPTVAAAVPANTVHVFLTGTVAFSASDAWTVGWGGINGVTASANAESLHWNGKRWVFVKTVNEAGFVNGLEGISGISPSALWGVGWINSNCLIEHYNGRKWSGVACPYKGVASQLNAVDARTSKDAWAVGFVDPSSNQTAFAENWNGHRWAEVKTASVSGSFIQLTSVLDLGPGNVLAVGYYETKSGTSYVQHELAEHWNGHAWLRVSVPQFSTASFLMGLSGSKSAGVTAVGSVRSGGHDVPLIERWTGSRFVRVSQPVGSGDLAAVAVLSKTSAYATGSVGSGKTLVEHYNGSRWAEVSSPSPADGGYLAAVAATRSGRFVEAAGWHGADPNEVPLVEQGNGRTWRITPS
jgi:hypothetical protein